MFSLNSTKFNRLNDICLTPALDRHTYRKLKVYHTHTHTHRVCIGVAFENGF